MYLPIARNKRNTIIAMVVFMLIFAVFGGVVAAIFAYRGQTSKGVIVWDGSTFAFVLGLVVIIAAAYMLYMYSSADKTMLRQTGAKAVTQNSDPRLYNMVQNLAITSGLPMPKVYIIADSSPNAFTTGRDPEHSSVAVTRGLMDLMDDDELEAVIGHEISHIKNYDIRVNTIVFGLTALMGIVVSVAFRGFLYSPRSRSSNSRDNNAGLLILLILILTLVMKVFMNLISLVISRQREYLADASAAELMHNNEALASALEKLRGNAQKVKKYNVAGSHLFFSDPDTGDTPKKVGKGGIATKIHNLFNTHPPLDLRIARLRGFGDVKQGMLASR